MTDKRARSPNAAAAAAGPQRDAGGEATASILAPPKDYEGIRLGPYKYIAWPNGEKELYDIEKDPNELNNIVRIPNYFPIRNYLHRELRRLRELRRPGLPAKRRPKSR